MTWAKGLDQNTIRWLFTGTLALFLILVSAPHWWEQTRNQLLGKYSWFRKLYEKFHPPPAPEPAPPPEPTPPPIMTLVPKGPPDPSKVYISEQLWDIFKGLQTSEDFDNAGRRLVGKYACFEAPAIDFSSARLLVTLELRDHHVFCLFNEKWKQQIQVLQKGQKLRISGRVSQLGEDWMRLEDCEFVDQD